jgi:carbonic anhydrase
MRGWNCAAAIVSEEFTLRLPKSLADGYWRFRRERHASEKGRYRQLAELGQSPTAMVIACCDARVDVSAIFDAEPGDLFIMRNVANLVPPFEPEGKFHGTSAAVEYAALVLKVPNIIVLGHSHCGGVAAYREKLKGNVDETSFIARWLTLLDGLKVKESDISAFDRETAFELAGIRQSLANLRTFDALKEREAEGLLTLHGLHFDIASGTVIELDDGGSFAPLAEEAKA